MNPLDDKSKAWSALFSEPVAERVARYTASVGFDRRLAQADIEASRADLKLSWEWRQKATDTPASQRDAKWEQALEAFQQQVAQINQRIADYNLAAPSERFQRMKLNLGREIEAVTGTNQ